MKIIFANQKGGVGKTTLSVLLANYLALIKKEEVMILDMDDQRSVFDKWTTDGREHDQSLYNEFVKALSDYPDVQDEAKQLKADIPPLEHLRAVLSANVKKHPGLKIFIDSIGSYSWDSKQLYPVLSKDLEEYSAIKPMLDKAKDAFIIMDLPGKMDDNNLIPIYQDADLVICPMRYDELTIVSTFTFAAVLRQINPDVPMVFIPNRIKANVKYELKAQLREKLTLYGTLKNDLPDWVSLERLNTYSLPNDITSLLSGIYDDIYNQHLVK